MARYPQRNHRGGSGDCGDRRVPDERIGCSGHCPAGQHRLSGSPISYSREWPSRTPPRIWRPPLWVDSSFVQADCADAAAIDLFSTPSCNGGGTGIFDGVDHLISVWDGIGRDDNCITPGSNQLNPFGGGGGVVDDLQAALQPPGGRLTGSGVFELNEQGLNEIPGGAGCGAGVTSPQAMVSCLPGDNFNNALANDRFVYIPVIGPGGTGAPVRRILLRRSVLGSRPGRTTSLSRRSGHSARSDAEPDRAVEPARTGGRASTMCHGLGSVAAATEPGPTLGQRPRPVRPVVVGSGKRLPGRHSRTYPPPIAPVGGFRRYVSKTVLLQVGGYVDPNASIPLEIRGDDVDVDPYINLSLPNSRSTLPPPCAPRRG